MIDQRDIVDIASLSPSGPRTRTKPPEPPRAFLSIWFRCCHVYGRLYRNAAQTTYNGACPKCTARARVLVRPDGTARRCFQAL